jgi:ubiquinone/menaquinone biosynthesis C-methylase UbiE
MTPRPRATSLDRAGIQALYTRRSGFYRAYVQTFAHRQGMRALIERSGLLAPDWRIPDAGCGSGLRILGLTQALQRQGFGYQTIDGFDLTDAMLQQCRRTVERRGLASIRLHQADITMLDQQLPPDWTGYDLILCASMLQHFGRGRLAAALDALHTRLGYQGRPLIVATRATFWPTRCIWHCDAYSRHQLEHALTTAGFATSKFVHYPWTYAWLNIGNHAVRTCHTSDN